VKVASQVIREYRCDNCHRIFDSAVPSCIHCGSTEVTRIFTQPFAFKSDKTKFTDSNIQHLTEEFNLSDYSNNESTKHTPESKSFWKPVANKAGAPTGTVDLTDLQIARTGSMPVKELPSFMNIEKRDLPDIERPDEAP
jgi:hypothetical protein